MWWKVYFWSMTTLALLTLVFGYGNQPLWKLGDFVDIAVLVVDILALYAFAFRKKLFTQEFWKVFLGVEVLFFVEMLMYFTPWRGITFLPRYEINAFSDPAVGPILLMFTMISLPLYYVIYQLGFSKTAKPSKKKK